MRKITQDLMDHLSERKDLHGIDVQVNYAKFNYHIPNVFSKNSFDPERDGINDVMIFVSLFVEEWLKNNKAKLSKGVSLEKGIFSFCRYFMSSEKFHSALAFDVVEKNEIVELKVDLCSLTFQFARMGNAIGVRIKEVNQKEHVSGEKVLDKLSRDQSVYLRKTIKSFEIRLSTINKSTNLTVDFGEYFEFFRETNGLVPWEFSQLKYQDLLSAYKKGRDHYVRITGFFDFFIHARLLHVSHERIENPVQREVYSSNTWRRGNILDISQDRDNFKVKFKEANDLCFSFGIFPETFKDNKEKVDNDFDFSKEQASLEESMIAILSMVNASSCFHFL